MPDELLRERAVGAAHTRGHRRPIGEEGIAEVIGRAVALQLEASAQQMDVAVDLHPLARDELDIVLLGVVLMAGPRGGELIGAVALLGGAALQFGRGLQIRDGTDGLPVSEAYGDGVTGLEDELLVAQEGQQKRFAQGIAAEGLGGIGAQRARGRLARTLVAVVIDPLPGVAGDEAPLEAVEAFGMLVAHQWDELEAVVILGRELTQAHQVHTFGQRGLRLVIAKLLLGDGVELILLPLASRAAATCHQEQERHQRQHERL